MSESKANDHLDRLTSLEKENAELRTQIAALSERDSDFHSYKIFENARKKFLSWISLVTLGITAFGIVSATSIISSIEQKIEERGIEKIIIAIKDDFIETHQENIVDQTKEAMIPLLTAKIEQYIREELLYTAKNIERQADTGTDTHFAQAIEKSYQDKLYLVIAASSILKKDLERHLQDLKSKMGDAVFNDKFKDANICSPSPGKRHYALVISSPLPYSEANELKDEAIQLGFRSDTFLRSLDRANFYFVYKRS